MSPKHQNSKKNQLQKKTKKKQKKKESWKKWIFCAAGKADWHNYGSPVIK
jgi:hypothetical protein